MCGSASSTAMISLSVEFFPFIFCFWEIVIAIPLPNDIPAPVWLLQSSCTACDASTHQLTTGASSAVSLIPSPGVPLRYFRTLLSLSQSSLSGPFTCVVRKATGVCISYRALAGRNKSCATVWWNMSLLLRQLNPISIVSHFKEMIGCRGCRKYCDGFWGIINDCLCIFFHGHFEHSWC